MLTSVGPSGPHYPRIVGSTVTFEVAFQGGMPDDNLSPSDRASQDVHFFRGSRPPDLVGVTSSYGWMRTPSPFHFDAPPTGGSDPNDPSLPARSASNEVEITSVPVGPQTFTVTYYWTLLWDGTLPRVVATRSVSSQITVKP